MSTVMCDKTVIERLKPVVARGTRLCGFLTTAMRKRPEAVIFLFLSGACFQDKLEEATAGTNAFRRRKRRAMEVVRKK